MKEQAEDECNAIDSSATLAIISATVVERLLVELLEQKHQSQAYSGPSGAPGGSDCCSVCTPTVGSCCCPPVNTLLPYVCQVNATDETSRATSGRTITRMRKRKLNL